MFLILLIFAAYWDYREKRIPNWLTYTAVLSGLAVYAFDGEIISSVAGALCIGLVFLLLPGLKAGGGDLKLAAGVGAWIGYQQVLPFVLFTIIGVLTAAVLKTWAAEGAQGISGRVKTEIKTLGAVSLPLAEVRAAPFMLLSYVLLLFWN